jgi:hypothetical protein
VFGFGNKKVELKNKKLVKLKIIENKKVGGICAGPPYSYANKCSHPEYPAPR